MGEFGRPFVGGGGEGAGAFSRDEGGKVIVSSDTGDSWVVGSDRMDEDPDDVTKGTRAFFDKVKGAFRAGTTTNRRWQGADRGDNSFAAGHNTRASGANSSAFGSATNATGENSHAEGYLTNASGVRSHAEGSVTKAIGPQSHTEGSSTEATEQNAHAEGAYTEATQIDAHAEGHRTVASGVASHAEGTYSQATQNQTHAGGAYALAHRFAQYARASGRFAALGDAQASRLILMGATTDATAKILLAGTSVTTPFTDTTHPYIGPNVWTLPTNRAHKFRLDVAARRTDIAGEAAGWEFSGLIARDATGDPYFVGNVEGRAWGAPNAAAWDVTLSIDTTTDVNNPFLAITATGEAGKTIRWVASLDVVEVG